MEPRRVPPSTTDDRTYYLFALKIVGDFGATLALPVVVFVLAGRFLDNHFGIGPWCTVLAFILAGTTSAILVLKKARIYGDEYQRLNTPKS